jgi:hypothetical protein
MVSRVLTQVVEGLCILHNSASSLCQIQKFIELSLNESFEDVMRSKSSPKLIPGYIMTSWLQGMILIPPYAGSATELLGCKERFVLI